MRSVKKRKENIMPFSKRQSYRQKRIKAKIPVTVNNITKQQLDTLKHELQLMADPWKKQGVVIQVGKKVA